MRSILLNGVHHQLAPESTITQRAINPWKAQVRQTGGREYSDFGQAELEEYFDFRNGIGKNRGIGSDARLDFSEGVDFSIEGQAVLGPLVTSTSINALSAPSITNEDFETDVSPASGFGWTEGSGDWLIVSDPRTGTYAWQNTTVVVGENIYQDLTGYMGGVEYTFTIYIKCLNANDTVKLGINDGVTSTTFGTAVGNTGYTQVTVTKAISSGATQLRIIAQIAVAGAGGNIVFDDAAISVTAAGTFTPVNFIDFQSATYCYGDIGILKWNGSTWDYVVLFTNPIDALVITDSTDEYLVVTAALSGIYSIDGSAWLVASSFFTPSSTNDPDSAWTNEANAIDDDETSYATVSGADKFLELIFSPPVTADECRIYCSDGASGDANANIDFYYDGAWNDVFDGTVAGAEWVTKKNAAGVKFVEKIRIESSDGNTFRLWEIDIEAHIHGYLANFDNRLYYIHNDGTHVCYSTAKDIDDYAGGFELTGNYGTVYDFFAGKLLADGSNTLYFCGTEGLFSLDTTNELAYQQEVAYPPITNAGNVGMYWNANVWVSTGYGILKIAPSTATFVGPDQDDGLPSTYQGKVYDFATVNNWLVFCVNGGTTDKSSILKRNSSLGGNLQVYTTSTTNKPIAGIHHSPSSLYTNGRLWFGEGTGIKYMMFPDTTSNVKQISTYEYSGANLLENGNFEAGD
ncbi:hypothetical protein LCGC14_1978220, partial [marine sediment metagenome]